MKSDEKFLDKMVCEIECLIKEGKKVTVAVQEGLRHLQRRDRKINEGNYEVSEEQKNRRLKRRIQQEFARSRVGRAYKILRREFIFIVLWNS